MKNLTTGIAGAGLLLSMIAIALALESGGARSAEIPGTRAVDEREIQRVRHEIEALRAETRRLEAELTARASPVSPSSSPEADPAESSTGDEPKADSPPTSDLLDLGRRVIATTATPEETGRFWELARTPGLVDGLVEKAEADVRDAPTDATARMRLADAYVVKLFTVPAGPEMGVWGGKAEGEWREVLRLEPSHWQARFNLAVSLSYHPDVEGKTPEAIGQLERLVREQESRAPEPRDADVYRLLAILRRRQGDREAAEQSLRRGLERHPEDAKIRKALEEGRR